MIQTLINIGNSQGIILPKGILNRLKIRKGDALNIEFEDNETVVLSKKDAKKTIAKISPEFLLWLEEFNNRYKSALQELASK